MKLALCAALLAGCSSNICTMDVASMSTEQANGEVDLVGTFDESQPILILTPTSGAAVQIACSLHDGSTISAICDLKAASVPAGTYNVSFDMTCRDTSFKKDALAVGDTIAATLVVD